MNNDEKNIEEFEEDNENYITLSDEDGNELSFEVIGTVEYKDRIFAVLLPFEESEEDDGVMIFEVIPAEDPEYDDFTVVEDEELMNEVYEEFKKNYDGEYIFE